MPGEQFDGYSSDSPLLVARDLFVSFPDGGRISVVLRDVSLEVYRGSLSVVSGRSGSGKTTLLRSLLGLSSPNTAESRGSVWFSGHLIEEPSGFARLRRDHVVYVSQSAELVGFLTVMENLRISEALGGEPVSEDSCRSALSRLGVGHLEERFPAQLSGGERQRCAIARSMVAATPLLLVDEPTSALDDESADSVIDAILTVRDQGTAVLVSTHDSRIADISDKSFELAGGVLSCG